jgi:hypothetical protein
VKKETSRVGGSFSAPTRLAFNAGFLQDAVPSADFHFLCTVLDGERVTGNRMLGRMPKDFVFAVSVQIPAVGFKYLDEVRGGSLHRRDCLACAPKVNYNLPLAQAKGKL